MPELSLHRPGPTSISGTEVLELTDPRWADFVAGQPAATPFHHPDWGTLVADCYGFRAFAVTTSDATGQIQAGLPVIEVRHLHREPKWVSLPFTDYCPPLVSAPEDEARLSSALQQISEATGVRRVEVRAPFAGAVRTSSAFRHGIAIDGDPDRVFAAFPSKTRTHIRQAERRGVTVRRAEEPEDLLGIFYRLHMRTRRRLGVPVQPRRFFSMLWETMINTGLGLVLIAEAAGQPVAAAVVLAWNGTMIGKFIASDEEAWQLRPNNLLVWHAVQAASELGCGWFDFGRTDATNNGLRAYKQSWGAVEEPLVYGILGAKPEQASQGNGIASRLLSRAIRYGPLLLCRASGETLYRYAA
jgi:CelD/BcsL family acetyltransferase involved in cellulose biosynthesis